MLWNVRIHFLSNVLRTFQQEKHKPKELGTHIASYVNSGPFVFKWTDYQVCFRASFARPSNNWLRQYQMRVIILPWASIWLQSIEDINLPA